MNPSPQHVDTSASQRNHLAPTQAGGARVLQNTMAQVALMRVDERSKALRDTMLEL